MSVEETWVRNWFADQGKPVTEYQGNVDLVKAGLLDSFSLIAMIAEIKNAFEIELAISDIQKVQKEGYTISSIAGFIIDKQ
jgi:acyl carrier protein